MTNQGLKLTDFQTEKIAKNQQKTISGGDDIDPSKGDGKGAM
ncbi:rSAM-modified peptide [Flavobacterium sp. KBS0721]|nr:rSAM-modified peptide [Flavobacterium sp. KBS0721]QDW19773.1 rSAM-modified peptide [Flavobacterium sp. KBS0721]